ncbi:non-ribosomal peptide synthetase, partial [Kitasatospora sp. GAS204B]
ENNLLTHPTITATTVVLRQDTPGDKRLVAYLTAAETAPSAGELRAHLQQHLPDYMIPTSYVVLDHLPLTPNGKVDQKALPAPDSDRPDLDAAYLAPRTPVEQTITAIWSEILGVDPIGIHDNFFQLGGHSLLATQVTSRLRKELGVEVPVRSVFTAPTPAQLAHAIADLGADLTTRLAPAPRDGSPLPLSFAQQRLWFLDQLEPGSAEYLVPVGLHLRGWLDVAALQTALSGLVARHEVLRTRFLADEDGHPAQLVDAPHPVTVTIHDLSGIADAEAREAAAQELMAAEGARPFDLAAGRPLRADLVRLAPDEQYLLLTVHHIVSDGWSEGILARELRELYTAAVQQRTAELPDAAVQYADFAVWQRRWLAGEALDRQLDYWQAQLAGIEPLELPTDHRRPAERGGDGDAVRFSVPAEVTEQLKVATADQGASLFMTLLAVFQLLLSKYSGQQDITVGTPIAGRNRAEVEEMIGFFVNTLVLRADLSGDPTFRQLLEQVKETALGAYDHQDLPFERLVDELAPERDLSRNPLFQTMFVLQNVPDGEGTWALPGLAVEQVGIGGQAVKFDLQLTVVENGGGLDASVEYRTDLFEPATMERLVGHFQTLLAGVAARPEARLSELEMLTAAERQQIVVDWNATGGDYPDTATIHSLIEERCAREPDAIALTCGDTVLTCRQVNERANQLAHHLRDQGVTPDTLIAVCLDRSPDLICALLGILKAGAAFVPLDPDYPTDRITYMVEDTATPLVITHSRHTERLPSGTSILLVDQGWPATADTSNPIPTATPDHLAYLIYTSGSTGRPKGVQLDHRGVVNYLHWCDQNYPAITPNGIGTLLYSSVTFDLTITALFLPLIQGQQLAIPQPAPDQSAFDATIDLILTGTEISFLKATPSHLELLTTQLELTGTKHNIATIVAGGEELTPTLANRIFTTSTRTTVIANEYGATEGSVANVMSLSTTIDPTTGTTPVGTAITNTTAYVVDRFNHPVPIGIPGECLLGGICVARGYHNRPELTTTRFIQDPFSTDPTARAYRTGDLVRWREDGHMEFIGRIDNQVKLRGYRIELGEIENNLLTHPTITATTVVLRQDTPGDKRLVAYLVSTNTPTITELRTHLQHHLPDYMIPTTYITLPHLPLTPNGKVDQKALPTPDHHRPDLDATYTPPRTPVEQTLAAIWSEILGVDPIGIHDNFFELGGDSIISIQVIAKAKKFGLHLTPRMIFKYQTIAEIAGHAQSGASANAEQGKVLGDVALTPIQHWFFEKELPSGHHFNQAELLATECLDPTVLERALTDLTEHHDALRLRYRRADDSSWTQHSADSAGRGLLDVHDLSEVSDEGLWSVLRGIGEEVQRSLDLADGPILRGALLNLGGERGQRFLLTVHHLAIDSVSWRILLEDLGSAYERRAAGRAPQLPPKTTSFKAWAEKLSRFAVSAEAEAEFGYWSESKPSGRLPRDRDGANEARSADTVSATLTPKETSALLREVPRAFNTQINDALLTALARAVARWTGDGRTLIGLEGHGREDLFSDVDLSRTIGWFTSVFPVALTVDPAADPVSSLAAVKEQLARIPNKGVGYGILRYLGRPEVTDVLQAQPSPEVNFNYLGQFTEQLPGIGRYADPTEPKGHSISPDGMRWNVLDITAAVEGDTFHLNINYSAALHNRRTVERLAADLLDGLRQLISAGAEQSEGPARATEGTPLTDVSATDMAAILKRFS